MAGVCGGGVLSRQMHVHRQGSDCLTVSNSVGEDSLRWDAHRSPRPHDPDAGTWFWGEALCEVVGLCFGVVNVILDAPRTK